MPFDFPASPSDGQTVTLGTTRWQWSAAQGAWMMQSGNVGPAGPQGPAGPAGPAGAAGAPGPTGGVTIAVSDTEPNLPADNSLWWKSNSGALWLRYRDSDAAQWLQVNSNLILPPQDGNEYVMVNGLWRLKSQTLILDGLTGASAPVPVGARMLKMSGNVTQVAAASNSMTMRVSLDGTNFMQGAGDYSHSGFIHYSNTGTAIANLSGSYANAYLAYNSTTANAMVFQAAIGLIRPSGWRWDMNTVGSAYGASGWADHVSRIQVMETNAGSVIAIKAVQFSLATAGSLFAGNSTVDLEWVY